MCLKPLYNRSFAEAVNEWKEGFAEWERGERPDYCSAENAALEFWEWHGEPPDRESYRPEWTEQDATWFQVYETVSEGTPVTPAFSTREELIDYLVNHGDYWDQRRGNGGISREAAEAFVMGDGFVLSMSISKGVITAGIEQAKP